jgi:methyl-accepting chemotaxis protein
MKSMSIARQFLILVVAFAVAMPAAVGALVFVFYRNQAAARKVADNSDRQTNALFALVGAVGQAQSTVQRLVREKDPDNLEKLIEQRKIIDKTAADKIREAGAADGDVGAAFQALTQANEKSVGFLLQGNFGMAQQTLIEESNPAFERLLAAIDKTRKAASEKDQAIAAEAEKSSRRAQVGIFILVGIVLAGLIAFALAMVRRVTQTLARAVGELKLVADGAASAARQISEASQTLAQGSSEQAASLEETSASSEEISATTCRNAENSERAAERMNAASRQIADANARLEQMVVSMNEIDASSDKISRIIKTIDEIAFQTNILALNAAVEAARAGEAGMGFAVVADEVRNLAQRCAQAARDTATLIEDSIGKSKDGKNKLDQVASTFRSITGSAGEVKTLVDEVQIASNEQARGIQQVSQALAQMDQVTQKNAASAEQSAAAGQELSSQSMSLKATVARLAALVEGTSDDHAGDSVRHSASARRGHPPVNPAAPLVPGRKAAAAKM